MGDVLANERGKSPQRPRRVLVVAALGITQILGWGTSFYFPAVFAAPIVADTNWSLGWVVGGVSIGLLVAGVISPRVGRAIERRGGRPVLAFSSILFAAGLAGIGLAPVLPLYLAAWIVVGIAMGTGLYDAAFAALGRLYGREARAPITNLTLIAGFASTVCWPLSAVLVEAIGWRGACLAYAALHLALGLPLQFVMPRQGMAPPAEPQPQQRGFNPGAASARDGMAVFALLAAVLTLAAGIGSVVVVHPLTLLQARGVEFAVAVTLGTLLGPAQVGARMVERIFGPHYHPIWTMIAACLLMAGGLVLLQVGFPVIAFAIVIYAAGYGITWVARGTLPLVLYGPERYARVIGRLALPSLIVQALAPSAGALLIEWTSADAAIAVLTACALANVVLIGLLWGLCRRRIAAG
jgi:MFS family permease